MKKNIFTNKFFIITLFFIALLFSFATSCFASIDSSYTVSIESVEFSISLDDSLSSNYDYIFICYYINHYSYGDSYVLCTYLSNSPFIFDVSNASCLSLCTSDGSSFLGVNYSNPPLSLTLSSSNTYSLGSGTGITCDDIVYSNSTIIDSNGDVVFYQAPVQGESQQGETQGIQTLTLEQAEQIPQAMTQTLQVILPIGLLIFGIGLAIFLVRWVILRLM